MLWKTTRALEKQLNKAQPEPYVYIIENSEMLAGVNYVFNVTAINNDGTVEQPKSFNIDNTQGDNKLMIEGRNDMISVFLVGAQIANADETFTVNAEVTTCYPTQDYFFSWTVRAVESAHVLNVSHILSSNLEIAPFSLIAGLTYNINCKVLRKSNEDLITQTNLPFKVAHRGLEVYLSADYLMVFTNYTFSLESLVINHDYYESPLTYTWQCLYENNENCIDFVDSKENGTLTFRDGLPFLGEYTVMLKVTVLDQECSWNCTIIVVEQILPILQVTPLRRLLNDGSEVVLTANASNVAPTCSLTWYFATNEYLDSLNENICNETQDHQHGELLSDTLTIFSLEEQFLSELSDFTNETEWRQVTTSLRAQAGRARFLAECGCSLTFSCKTLGEVYADIWFQLNKSPKAGEVKIAPESGTALESTFRISTRAAVDPDSPLKYSFYCSIGADETLSLASNSDHRSVETILPFVVDGTEVWVEVCDAFGACSKSNVNKIVLSPGEGRTLETLLQDASAHVRRCELDLLRRVAMSALVTYNNTQQTTAFSKLCDSLRELLLEIKEECRYRNIEKYSDLLNQLQRFGFESNNHI
ncbi:unnamed protein product [Chilo suppressalis]|nr:unnamed protein product [Chilo suppressalis]